MSEESYFLVTKKQTVMRDYMVSAESKQQAEERVEQGMAKLFKHQIAEEEITVREVQFGTDAES